MTENQTNYVHFNAFGINNVTGFRDVTFKCVLHGTKLMHITFVHRHPNEQPNRKKANKYVDERMEQYLLTGKKGFTVTFEEVVNSMSGDSDNLLLCADIFCFLDIKKLLEVGDFTWFKSSALKYIIGSTPIILNKIAILGKEINHVSN